MTKLLLHSHRSCSSQESFPAKVFFPTRLLFQPGVWSRKQHFPCVRGNRFGTGELQARAVSSHELFPGRSFFQHSTVSGLTLTFQFVGNLNQNRRICWHLQTPFQTFHAFGVWGINVWRTSLANGEGWYMSIFTTIAVKATCMYIFRHLSKQCGFHFCSVLELWSFLKSPMRKIWKPLMALSFLNQVFLGLVAISLWCSTEWTPSGRFVSPAASQFLLSHCFVSKKHSPFANYFLHCLFLCFISFQH